MNKINRYFNRYHWPENIKQEFPWFLSKDILIFTTNNIPEKNDYKLLQSMLKVFFNSKLNLNLIKMRWHTFLFSAII